MTRVKVDPLATPPLVVGPWSLSDLRSGKLGSPKNNLKVFSCFHCGGGSSMGYRLAGYTVLGGVEVDKDMMEIYRKNHEPDAKFSMLMPIQDFPAIPRENLPVELFDLDVLDGSPPCSSFSMAGSREDAWGEKKAFREGQTEQVLDDLFFHFIRVAEILRPKVVIAENVKGLVMGSARGYVKEIFAAYDKAGYSTQLFLLNASRMGVPQARERTFFISTRKDLKVDKLDLSFDEKVRTFGDAIVGIDHVGKPLTGDAELLWRKTPPGNSLAAAHHKGNRFTWVKLNKNKPANTATSGPAQMCHDKPNMISGMAQVRIQGFPDDYCFGDQDPRYVCGMSVPPLMMQRVATEVARQALLPLRERARRTR